MSASTPKTAAEVREAFLRFFEERGHKVQVVADQVKNEYAGKYLKILITK
jgi:alanyl-tRNA synthetase